MNRRDRPAYIPAADWGIGALFGRIIQGVDSLCGESVGDGMFTRIVICFAFLLGGLTLSSHAMAAPKKSAKKADAKVMAKPGKKGKKAKLKKIKAKVKLGDVKGKLAGQGSNVQADSAKSCPSYCEALQRVVIAFAVLEKMTAAADARPVRKRSSRAAGSSTAAPTPSMKSVVQRVAVQPRLNQRAATKPSP